ncbi:MAG TPA: hypothetical protein PKC30_03500 [Saprospiraceae bacterium]|nr:hypothetical protein [Saprospiraceae bacterium]
MKIDYIIKFFSGKVPVYSILTDTHAHWLPGIDDGPKSVDESLEMLKRYNQMGFRHLIATPHIYRDYYPNTRQSIKLAFEEIQKIAKNQFPNLHLSFAAEYYLDDHFDILLKNRELLTFGVSYVLVEQGFFAETPGLNKTLFEMQIAGYQPVLAHPERYIYYHKNDTRVHSLKNSGVKFQVNLLSLAGKYGKTIAQKASKWIDQGLIDFVGTDAHHSRDLDLIRNLQLKVAWKEKLGGMDELDFDRISTS